ncbi:hypothetical protein SISSUDRAFT_1131147 [Sistotremastrum suecicum HHB10207 ss-3]|uniref:Auxin efflux carrier n=1 Tax=Sistotremastrum suecicum HHB10207 ss-3 TaxID=1314776 RepID=A0A166AJ57_9AGAM|nr:hypothetical protein SISSUDRAFT_1131147 [Sistotremastrum suecicum HHB10207 ss-3]
MANTPIWPLLRTVFESILEVFLLCIAGFVLAKKGILDKKTQKQLNILNVSLFTPSLLFSKVAFFLSPAKLKELWIIPIFFVVTTCVSMSAAWVMSYIFRLKRSQRNFAMAASMFMNSNSLPIALMQSLVVTVPALKWGDDDPSSARLGRALTYLVLYSTMGMMLRWSYGVHLLSQADDDKPTLPTIGTDHSDGPSALQVQEDAIYDSATGSPTISSSSQLQLEFAAKGSTLTAQDAAKRGVNPASHQFYSLPLTPSSTVSRSHSAEGRLSDDESSDEPLRFSTAYSTLPAPVRKVLNVIKVAFRKFLAFMTAPLWAALASLIVACLPFLQHALEEHLQPLKNGVTNAGACSIPVTLIVLGAYFYTPPDPTATPAPSRRRRGSFSDQSIIGSVKDMFKMRTKPRERALLSARNENALPGEGRTVFVAVVSRMLITPMILLPFMAMSAYFDLQDVLDDPVFVVANVLLISSPPALTLAQITQASSGDAFERLISRTIFWAYCIVTPPATIIYVVIGLMLSKL